MMRRPRESEKEDNLVWEAIIRRDTFHELLYSELELDGEVGFLKEV